MTFFSYAGLMCFIQFGNNEPRANGTRGSGLKLEAHSAGSESQISNWRTRSSIRIFSSAFFCSLAFQLSSRKIIAMRSFVCIK
jgi:hypothetical protein